jgi:hypothetical protein
MLPFAQEAASFRLALEHALSVAAELLWDNA